MALSKKFSELPSASSLTNNDLFAIAHEDSGAETGYESQKATATQIAKKILNGIEFPTDLPDFPANEQNPIDALEYLNSKINDLYPVDSASGAIANFSTPLALPLVNLKANIVAQQDGFSSVVLKQTGKNLFDKNNLTDGKAISSDGSITDNTYAKLSDYIPINGKCVFSAIRITGTAGLRFGTYDENKNFISRATSAVGSAGTLATVTINNPNVKFVRANIFTTSEDINTAQIEIGTTATTYEAYSSNTITIDLGENLTQGGVLDVITGVLTRTDTTTKQLIPYNFTTLVGTNNIFADSGDVELSFKQGIQEYIDAKIAEVQALVL